MILKFLYLSMLIINNCTAILYIKIKFLDFFQNLSYFINIFIFYFLAKYIFE